MILRANLPSRLAALTAIAAACALFSPAGALAQGSLETDPQDWDFGSVLQGQSKATWLFVSNTSVAPVEIRDVRLDDPPHAYAIDPSQCGVGVVLDPGEACGLLVTFRAPATSGGYGAVVIVEGAETGESALAFLAGTSYREGHLVGEPASLDFGSTPNFTMTASRPITFRNVGDTDAIVTHVFAESHFAVTSTDCVRTIAPGGACNVSVMFRPGSRYGLALTGAVAFRMTRGTFTPVVLTGTSLGPPAPGSTPSIFTERDLGDLTDAVPGLVRGGPRRWRALPQFKAPTAGRLSLTLFGWNRARRMVIGGGALGFAAPKAGRLRFRLNRRGVALLRRPQRTRIKVVLKFDPRYDIASRQGPEYLVKPPLEKPKRG